VAACNESVDHLADLVAALRVARPIIPDRTLSTSRASARSRVIPAASTAACVGNSTRADVGVGTRPVLLVVVSCVFMSFALKLLVEAV
jgi:hypothetical protein